MNQSSDGTISSYARVADSQPSPLPRRASSASTQALKRAAAMADSAECRLSTPRAVTAFRRLASMPCLKKGHISVRAAILKLRGDAHGVALLD